MQQLMILMAINKSLIVASSWSHLYLLIKDARSFEYKVLYRFIHKQYTEEHNETEYPERKIHNNKNT